MDGAFIGGFIVIWLGLVLLGLLLPILAIVSILQQDAKASEWKLIWTLVVLVFPFLGPIAYFIVGRST